MANILQTPGELNVSYPGPFLYWKNLSTVLTEDMVREVIKAVQIQLSRDLFPHWGINLQLEAFDFHRAAANRQIVFLDDAAQATDLGYRQMTSQGKPLIKIYARDAMEAGVRWSVVTSHEIISAAIDPWCDLATFNLTSPNSGTLYAMEVCDPVCSDAAGYDIGGIRVSNFVLPSWFQTSFVGQVDFTGTLRGALEIGQNGITTSLAVGVPESTWVTTISDDRPPGLYRPVNRMLLRQVPKELRTISSV